MPDTAKELSSRAASARRDGRPAKAKKYLAEAARIRRAELARVLARLGQIERDLNSLDAALHHYQEAVVLYRGLGDTSRLAHTVRHVGDIHQDAGRLESATPHYDEALALYRADPATAPLDLANAIRSMATLYAKSGDSRQAAALWREAQALYGDCGVEAGVAEARAALGQLAGRA